MIEYKDKVKAIIENGTGLKMNEAEEKTIEIELIKNQKKQELNFLGYMFQFEKSKFLQIKLTKKKREKYEDRITKALNAYNKQKISDSRSARRLLIHRMNFLTSNTRLENNKDNVLVGVFYSNSLLTSKLEDLIGLDEFLYHQVDSLIIEPRLTQRLKSYSFKKGFENRTFSNFNSKKKKVTLKEILEIW